MDIELLPSDDIVKVIRKRLKNELGYSNRKVSVKQSGSEMVVITIKDSTVSYQSIREITDIYESISRDEMSGEILAGGNTYIRIESEVIDPYYLERSQEIIKDTEETDFEGRQYEINNLNITVIKQGIKKRIIIKEDNIIIERLNIRTSEQLAKELTLLY